MKKRCVIRRVSVILTAVLTLLSCSMLSSAEEIGCTTEYVNEFAEYISPILLEAKPASEYQEKISWKRLTENDCVKMGLDFDTVSRSTAALASMSEGDVVEINSSDYEQLRKSGVLSSLGVPYIEKADGSDVDRKMTVYFKDGIKHSMFTSADGNLETMTIDGFTNMIDTERGNIAMYSGSTEDARIATVVIPIPHTGQCVEVGQNVTYTCNELVRYAVFKEPASDLVNDYYCVYAIHEVQPCITPAFTYCTQYHSSGIAVRYADEFIFEGVPDSSLILNTDNMEIDISLGIPWVVETSFNLELLEGTNMVAGYSLTMHDIAFSNMHGIYSPESSNGQFTYKTVTDFVIPEGRQFGFQHNHYMRNAVIHNGNSPTVFYDDWVVVVPELGLEPEPEPSRYVVDGLDYGLVFDSDYYLVNNPDVYSAYGNDWIAAFYHFLNSGMAEARVAKATFNVVIYRNRYPDLNSAFGDDWVQYYRHYIQHGAAEGREGV